MIIVFISLCLILLGIFFSLVFKSQRIPVLQKIKLMKYPMKDP